MGRPKKNKFHGENYTQEELLTLLHLARGDVIYPAILLAGAMGLRRSEALGVRWSRIDWEKRTVLLDTKIVEYRENGEKESGASGGDEEQIQPPHPASPRPGGGDAPGCRKSTGRCTGRCSKAATTPSTWTMCASTSWESCSAPAIVTDHFRELLEKYGLRHIRFHDLRHTFASLLINQDVPLINVSNFLGHSDLSTTANIYAHLDKASKQASADVISEILQPEGETEDKNNRKNVKGAPLGTPSFCRR